jgi:predicted short-subunit dehydrogenase-like oxidoreductase (DUF2520 family)
MTFNIIGTGNTAWFLAQRLTAAGHTCLGVYGRNAEKAGELASKVSAVVYPAIIDIPDNADCCIVAISDNAIETVAATLSFRDTVLLHTAGSVGMRVLNTNNTAVLWPVYSIVKTAIPEHRDIPFVWEGNTAKAKTIVQELAKSISDITYELDSQQRAWLHLSAVLGNNFSNHLMSLCEQMSIAHHIPFNLLYPILQQTFDRVTRQSPRQLQTGPAKRGDHATMDKHLDMLATTPHIKDLYKAISTSIENMYKVNEEEKDAKR